MVFTEPVFLFIFLPLLVAVYFLPGPIRHFRNLLLLLASLFFYAWGEKVFVFVMMASILFNYGIGLWIESQKRHSGGRQAIILGVTGNLLFLAIFKYADFIVANINSLLSLLGQSGLALPQPGIDLPIGISFFTFQVMSYLVDVHRGDAEVQRNPLDIALYVSLFPQLVAGPIVRYRDVAAQIVSRAVTTDSFAEGVRRFIIGLGKKVLIADTCARAVDAILGVAGNQSLSGVPLEQLTCGLAWLAMVCYAIQIYFDFSGYSDMAIGLGHMFGFQFLENFDFPYVSVSITEFWRRWHISLTTWFRDYLYIPLGGNRGTRLQTYRNLVVVFFLCGLWHGASWNFIIWGMYHGIFLVLERICTVSMSGAFFRLIRHLYVLLVVIVGWVFFRSEDLQQASALLAAMVGMGAGDGSNYDVGVYLDSQLVIAIVLGVMGSVPLFPALKRWRDSKARSMSARCGSVFLVATILCEQTYLIFVLILCAMFVASESYSPFIYFRF